MTDPQIPSLVFLGSEDAQKALARRFARAVQAVDSGFVLFLQGDLGTGKTTFARSFIHASGFDGVVKSPTYTLVEPYEIAADSAGRPHMCYHFDLYRLADPEELEFTGSRDYFNETSVCLVEWPEKAEGFLPEPDAICRFSHHKTGRNLELIPMSDKGKSVMLQVFSD